MSGPQGFIEFVKVIETGSFSAAARALGKSKAYVSQKVRSLEDNLGSRLLQRTTRKLSLTEAGDVYYRYASQAVKKLIEAEERARDFQVELKGPIRVSIVDGGLGEWYLAPMLVRFAVQNPEVVVDLDLSSRLVDLIEENYDFAVRVGNLTNSSLIARKLTSFRFGLYASPAFIDRMGIVTSPEQLRNYNCLTGATLHWHFKLNDRTFSFSPQGSWHSKSGQTLIAAAKEGLGIVRTASFYAEEALASGEIIEVLPDWTSEETPVWIVYPSNINLPRRVRSAINYLIDTFNNRSLWRE